MEIFNNLNVPPVKIDWKHLQELHCEMAQVCTVAKCSSCLFDEYNQEQFRIWYKSNLKNDERKPN